MYENAMQPDHVDLVTKQTCPPEQRCRLRVESDQECLIIAFRTTTDVVALAQYYIQLLDSPRHPKGWFYI